MCRIASQLFLGLLCCGVLGIGCATSLTRPELKTRLLEVGSQVKELVRPRVFPIHAGTRMEAITLLADARTEPRRRLSLDLAQQVSLGKTRRVHFVVGGPFADLNEQIVSNALDYQERELPGLVLVFVSPDPPDSELGALAQRKRVRLIHRPLQQPDTQ
jgi:hypothetical protein